MDTTPAISNNSEKLSSLGFYLLSFVLLASLLLFVPLLTDWFDLPRQTLLLVAGLIILTIFLLRSAISGKLTLIRSPFELPIIILIIASVVSAAGLNNKIASLSSEPVFYIGSALAFFLTAQIVSQRNRLENFIKVFLLGGALLSVFALIQTAYRFLGPVLNLPINIIFLNPGFSPTGSALSQALLTASLIPLAVSLYLQAKKARESVLLSLIFSISLFLGLVVNIYTLYINRPILLPISAGWRIATGCLGQSLQTAFLGVGPAHYLDAFNLYKPLEFNSSPYWNFTFTSGSNFYFFLLTTTGVIGLGAFILLLLRLFRVIRARLESEAAGPLEKGLFASLAICAGLFVFLPAPQVLLLSFFVLLALLVAHFRILDNAALAKVQTFPSLPPTALILGTIIAAAASLGLAYFLGRNVLADYYFARSMAAANANRGTETYNLQIKALTANPYNDSYHVSYSQTNLALANALAAQPNLSDQQKQIVVSLVQQAIREARVAPSLEPGRAPDWENLSLVYRSLINFAQGADQWAITSQNQAINLNPTNPRLRLDLGGIYLALGDNQSAGQAFAQAVNLKPDFANAHYNLAQALKALKLKDQALSQLQLTASLVCAPTADGSTKTADCQKVNAELADLGSTIPSATASATGSPETQTPLATPSSKTNLPNAATKPPAKVSSPSGELTP